MTEMEWNDCKKLRPMFDIIKFVNLPQRKKDLFSCACCRRIWHLLKDERSRKSIEIREQFALGLVGKTELSHASEAAFDARQEAREIFRSPTNEIEHHPEAAFAWAAAAVGTNPSTAISFCLNAAECDRHGCRSQEEEAQCLLLRDIIGNPYRSVYFDSSWHTSTVVLLARGIYADRAFDRMPILADALQDAGCESAEIIDHCRGPGPHVLGCWVIDLIVDIPASGTARTTRYESS